MTCPICDQKPMNCDCTDVERRQYSEICDMESLVDSLNAKVAAMKLTDEEREAVKAAVQIIDAYDEEMDGFPSGAAHTLRSLLERLK